MKVACVQMDVVFGRPEVNAGFVVSHLSRLKEEGVDLAVFPEACLTGYCAEDCPVAESIALDVVCDTNGDVHVGPNPVEAIRRACIEHEIHCVFGYAGRENGQLNNSAALVEPTGRMRRFVKVHLPELGYDKFVVPGNSLPVFQTDLGKIGLLICFDLRIPEAARVLALRGAELIVLPTNWPDGAEFAADYMAPVRAAENKVFLAACNRVGEENGFHFIGRSGIYGVAGETLAKAGLGPDVLTADLDLLLARNKHNVVVPGKFETDVFGSRRPDLYGPIVGGD